jgi:hypothetical protein
VKCHSDSECVVESNGQTACKCKDPTRCPATVKEVCGTDGRTYKNKCLLKAASCKGPKRFKVARDRPCGTYEVTFITVLLALKLLFLSKEGDGFHKFILRLYSFRYLHFLALNSCVKYSASCYIQLRVYKIFALTIQNVYIVWHFGKIVVSWASRKVNGYRKACIALSLR